MNQTSDATEQQPVVEESAPVEESLETSEMPTELPEEEAFEVSEPFSDLEMETVVIGPHKTKVALLLPLSGRHAPIGQALLNAAQLALFDQSGENFELLVRDTKGTPFGAQQAMESVMTERVELVLGPLFASSAQAIAPLAREAGVNVLSFSNDQAVAGSGVYVLGLTPEDQVRRAIGYAASQGIRRVGVFAPNTDYGRRVLQALRDQSYVNGVEISRIGFFNPNDPDLNDEVKAIANYDQRHSALLAQKAYLESKGDSASKKALQRLTGRDTLNPPDYEALVLPVGGKHLLRVAPLLNYYDVDPKQVRYIGTALWDNPRLGREPALVGSWFAAPTPAHWEGFRDRYRLLYGEQPPRLTTLAYDAVALAAVVARRAEQVNVKPDYSVRALTNPQGFAGLDGVFRLHYDGRSQRGLAVLSLQRDKIEVVDPAPTSLIPLTN